jgi:hypothetical protein
VSSNFIRRILRGCKNYLELKIIDLISSSNTYEGKIKAKREKVRMEAALELVIKCMKCLKLTVNFCGRVNGICVNGAADS